MFQARRVIRALDPFRRELKSPCDDERHGQAQNEQQDHEPDRPVRDLEKRKRLRHDLDEQPRDDGVGDCNLVNITPLQLGEEVARVHLR